MKKIIILMPVYNDWESLLKLLNEINLVINDINNYEFKCIIVNDCSTSKKPKIIKPKNFLSLKIINMKINKGHARCNASGLRYININEEYDYVIVMDSDGEDRPIEIKDLIKKTDENPTFSTVAKRRKRSEGYFFQFLYIVHKFITLIFTGKKVNFGNYSCITKQDVNILLDQASLWSSFSGSIKKNLKNLNEVKSDRGLRYFGPSKMSIINLILHSFSIIAVFKYIVFFRSTLAIVMLSFLIHQLGLISITLQIFLVVFNLLIFLISLRENHTELVKSAENILDENEILH
jgi:polyisoprenyl-phosphate glycosyltransferase